MFEGEFENDEMKEKGLGKFTYNNGEVYRGNYVDYGKREGAGTYTYHNGYTLNVIYLK